jgi:hypothetical protein
LPSLVKSAGAQLVITVSVEFQLRDYQLSFSPVNFENSCNTILVSGFIKIVKKELLLGKLYKNLIAQGCAEAQRAPAHVANHATIVAAQIRGKDGTGEFSSQQGDFSKCNFLHCRQK